NSVVRDINHFQKYDLGVSKSKMAGTARCAVPWHPNSNLECRSSKQIRITKSSHIVILSEAKNLGLIGKAPTELGQKCFASLNMTALFCETDFEFPSAYCFSSQSRMSNLESAIQDGSDSIVV